MSSRGQDQMDITSDSKLTSMAMSYKDSQDGAEGASEIQELLDWNNLVYTMPVTNSVVSARNLKTFRSDQLTYTPGNMMEFRLQTGSQYVDFKNSWIRLEMEIKNTDGTPANANYGIDWGSGSAFNLIRDMVVSSRSGTELQRIEDFNIYRAFSDTMKKPHDWFQTVGASIGYKPRLWDSHTSTYTEYNLFDYPEFKVGLKVTAAGNDITFSADTGQIPPYLPFIETDFIRFDGVDYNVTEVKSATVLTLGEAYVGDPNPTTISFLRTTETPAGPIVPSLYGGEKRTVSFALPMSMLEGVFAADQLCPSYLSAGMRIELRLESDIAKCFSAFNTNPLTYTINKAEIVLDTFLLNDASMIELKKVSASNGLEYVYKSIFRQKDSLGDGIVVEKTITKSVSRALTAWAIRKNATAVLNTDHYITTATLGTQQWRLGSQYYPHQKIDNSLDNYMNALYIFDTLYKPGSITLKQFADKYSYLAASFERSNLLRYSGAPINNSRVLSLSADYTAIPNNGASDLFMFLEYVTVAKVFLNNVVVTM